MKKKLLVILLVCVTFIGLTGCNNNQKSTAKNESSNSSSSKNVSIKDNSIYYVVINGKKFKAGEKISSVSKAGLNQKQSDLEETVPSNRYLLARSVVNKDGKEVCRFVPLNITDSTVTVKDAVIGGFEVGENNYSKIKEETLALNVEVVGGIKLGSTYDDLKRVFGEDDYKHEVEADPRFNMPAYTVYKYSSGYKSYEFIIDDSGKVSQINWNNYDYDE